MNGEHTHPIEYRTQVPASEMQDHMKDDGRRLEPIQAALKALSDPARQKVLLHLLLKRREGLLHKDLLAEFPNLDAPTLGRHLTILQQSGLVLVHQEKESEREEKRYFLADAGTTWLGRVMLAERPEGFLPVLDRQLHEGR